MTRVAALYAVHGNLPALEAALAAADAAGAETIVVGGDVVTGLGAVRFCHATPRSDEEIVTVRTPAERVRAMLAGVDEPLVVCGHTHMPFDRRVDGVRVVNAGGVGMPFGAARAHWLLLGPDVVSVRTAYDLAAAAARVRATRYPEAAEFADGNVLRPPGAEAMLGALEPGTRAG